jgi:hypothetical protein
MHTNIIIMACKLNLAFFMLSSRHLLNYKMNKTIPLNDKRPLS